MRDFSALNEIFDIYKTRLMLSTLLVHSEAAFLLKTRTIL